MATLLSVATTLKSIIYITVSDQDKCVREIIQPQKGRLHVFLQNNLDTDFVLFYLLSLPICERVGKNF